MEGDSIGMDTLAFEDERLSVLVSDIVEEWAMNEQMLGVFDRQGGESALVSSGPPRDV